MRDVDAVNSGYARVLLEEYLENPEAVPSEWRALFESGDGDLIEALPGLARLLENLKETHGHTAPVVTAPAPQAEPQAPPPSAGAPGRASGRCPSRRRRGGDVARQGTPDARASPRPPRPARQRAR